jgi:nucleoside-diphosphate-sugar epimerase
MKVLVTGSDGFVGRHTVKALRDRGIEVIEADKKTGQDLSNIAQANVLVIEEPDLIIHLAGSCSTLGSLNRPSVTFRDTVMSAVTVTQVAALLSIPMLLTSSVKARDGMTPYGAAKQMVETWALEMSRSFDFPLVINRPGTIYGPGQEGSQESGWIAWFLKAKQEGLEVVINGDGHQRRDLLHVSDYVDLLMLQVEDPRRYAVQTWDVGGGTVNVVTVNEIATLLGLDYTHGPERYGDARGYVGHNHVPGWKPKVFWRDSETFR